MRSWEDVWNLAKDGDSGALDLGLVVQGLVEKVGNFSCKWD